MELSLAAINLCASKFGKGKPCGFETTEERTTETMSEAETERIFDELVQNEMIVLSEDGIHISALGQHILNMMISPDQFIVLDNEILQVNVKIYIKNTYYLCAVEDKAASIANQSSIITIELLPGLREVVSSFAYALYLENENESSADEREEWQIDYDICAIAKAWDRDRIPTSEIVMTGEYNDASLRYQVVEEHGGIRSVSDGLNCEVSDFVNFLTKWMFARLSETMEREE